MEIWPNFPVPPAPDPCAPTPTPSPSTQPQTWTATAYDSAGVPLASVVTNDMTVTASTPDGILQMRHRDRVSKWEQYRGSMRLVADDSGLATINVLPFESYIRGVVPGEMPGGWSLEAVKAQAVAARSYAWARRKPTQMWDLSPVNTQVYGGYLIEHPGADAAIAATANTVMTFNGNVISAVFHTTSGGHTENSEFTFTNSNGNPGNIVGYLRGKPDVDANGRPYDLASPSYDWHTGQFTMSQLNDIYRANIQTDVGDIYSINYERGVSGRVYRVTLVGSTGTKVVLGRALQEHLQRRQAARIGPQERAVLPGARGSLGMADRRTRIEGEFRFEHPIEVRFVDTDAFGHVNNAVYLSYFEAARAGYYAEVTGTPFGTGARRPSARSSSPRRTSRTARRRSSVRRCSSAAASPGPAARRSGSSTACVPRNPSWRRHASSRTATRCR